MANEGQQKTAQNSSSTTSSSNSSSNSSVDAIDQLTKLLNEDPKPTEYDIAILRSTPKGDAFVKSENHLGLHAGDLPWIARDFRRAYREMRVEFLLEPRTCQYRLLNVTRCLLLVSPDHATAWADRKRALLSLNTTSGEEELIGKDSVWTGELEFLNLLMTKHTKA
jgi:hypothetical protein